MILCPFLIKSQVSFKDINGYLVSDRFLESGDYLRLSNISLAYNIPAVQLKKFRLQDAMISLAATNLFTITKYKGMDPESSNATSIPPLKILTIGVQVTF